MAALLVTILIAGAVGAVTGGALGAWLAGRGAWRGAVLVLIGWAAQAAAGAVGVDGVVWGTLVFLLALGLAGGRWGMGLSARALSLVAVGSILGTMALGAVATWVVQLA